MKFFHASFEFFLFIDSWNRIIVEISQGQPYQLGVGLSFARVWVNQNVSPKIYFGNFATGNPPILNGNNVTLDLCGMFDSASSDNVNPAFKGYFDLLNFIWIQGAQNLFQGASGSYQSVSK